jgi:predicted nucleic acid-binding protein
MTSFQVCVDAGISLKRVFLDEPDSELARVLWAEWHGRGATVIAPNLWAYEVTSVIRNKVHRGRLAPELEQETLLAVHQLPLKLMAPDGLHRRASEIARYFRQPAAYDAHYLALAQMHDCTFWTADERLFNTIRQEFAWVHWLGERRSADPSILP